MKTNHIIKYISFFTMLFLVIVTGKPAPAQNAGSFTQSDRERLIRFEEKFESLQMQIDLTNKRIDELKTDVKIRFDKQKTEFDQKFNEVMTFMYWGFGILFTMMMVLMGFVLWDRRTAIKPIENKTNRLEEALIEYAKTDPKLKEILRKAAIY